MQEERRYEPGRILEPAAKRMGISIESVLKRAGLSERFFEQDDPSVNAKAYFSISRAFAAELGGPDAWLAMALKFQAVPLVPPPYVLGGKQRRDFGPRARCPVQTFVFTSEAGAI